MHIYTLSHQQFNSLLHSENIHQQNVAKLTNTFFVCITDTFKAPDQLQNLLHTNDQNVLCLQFDDVNQDITLLTGIQLIAMSTTQAKQIVQFSNQFDQQSIVYIHCYHGASRSVAIAEYLMRTTEPTPHHHGRIDRHPNQHILNLLMTTQEWNK